MLTVIITGVSHGLGKSIAEFFAKNGEEYRIIGTGRSERPKELSGDIEYYRFDASNPDACKNFWQDIKDSVTGQLCLINNIGGYTGGDIKNSSVRDYSDMMNTNYLTAVNMTSSMISNFDSARLINIVSSVALSLSPSNIAYGASKSAVKYFYQSLQQGLSRDKYQITNIYPDTIATSPGQEGSISPVDLAELIFDIAKSEKSFYIRDITVNVSRN